MRFLGAAGKIGFGRRSTYATGGDYVYLYEEGGKTYRVHEFLTTGTSTLEVEVGGQMDVLLVGGGGGGGRHWGGGGGGGAGGVLLLDGSNSLAIKSGTYTVTVGTGGAGRSGTNGDGGNGANSSLVGESVSETAIGGGGGGGAAGGSNGLSGGSGGGGNGGISFAGSGGSGTSGQGNDGGGGSFDSSVANNRNGGGGGGASEAGDSATAVPDDGGDGGDGVTVWSKAYGGGGGGGSRANLGTSGIGGLGGGGNGGGFSTSGTDGEVNTGGGGGGNGSGADSGSGGSGIVIVRYVISDNKLWTPTQLGSSVAAWYDADISSYYDATSGGNLVQTNGTVVKRWEDVSGNAYHVSSSTTSTTLATNFLNGKNVLKGDGIANSGALTRADVPLGRNVANLSVVSVFKVNVSGGNKGPYGLYVDGSGKKRAHCYTDDNVFKYNSIRLDSDTQTRTNVDTGYFPTTVSATSSGWVISLTTSRFSQQSFRCYINGTIRRNDTVTGWTGNSSDTNSDRITVLGADYENQAIYSSVNGEMAEMLVIHDDVAFDDDLRTKLEGYLAHKWGLTNKLPSGHPYKYEPPYI